MSEALVIIDNAVKAIDSSGLTQEQKTQCKQFLENNEKKAPYINNARTCTNEEHPNVLDEYLLKMIQPPQVIPESKDTVMGEQGGTTRKVTCLGIKEWVHKYYESGNKKDNPIESFGKSFPFVGREKAIQLATKTVKDRWACHKADKFDQKSHPILVVAGSPGIGKTRLLYELPTLIQSQVPGNFLNLYISYGNGKSFSEMDQKDIVTAFALRLLHTYFNLKITLKIFINDWHNTFGSKLFIEHALDVIKSDFEEDLSLYISIDEFTQLLVESNNPLDRRKYLKLLVNAIGDCQIKPTPGVFLVTIFGGTIFTPLQEIISSSSYPTIHLQTPLLDNEEVRKIVKSTSSKTLLKDKAFIYNLMLLGGWARSLDYFLEEIDNLGPENSSSSKLDTICAKVSSRLASIYPLSSLTQQLIKNLIAMSITQLPVDDWSKSSPQGSNVVYEMLEQNGYISRVVNYTTNTTTVSFPLIYVNWTTLTFHDPAFILLQDFLNNIKQSDVFWQDWESYSATLLLLRCAMFEYLGQKDVIIQNLFGKGCFFSLSKPKNESPFHLDKLSLPPKQLSGRFSCIKLGHQYPTTTTKLATDEFNRMADNWDTVYINADGASFDWFLHIKSKSILPSSYLICGQSKFSKALPIVTCKDIDNEFNKAMNAVNSGKNSKIINGSTKVIFFVCTTRPFVYQPNDITPVSTVVAD